MSEHRSQASLARKALGLATACVVVASTYLGGQILHTTGPLPSFEVATIKPAAGAPIPSIATPTESRTLDVTARNLIEQAYRIPWTADTNQRVLGGPAWIDSDRYDVDARIDDSLAPAFATMSKEQQKDQTSLMMRSLLADRFKLKVHFESRELPIYALVIAKGGPRLTSVANSRPNADAEPQAPTLPTSASGLRQGILVLYHGQAAEMTAKAVTLDQLIHWLAGYSEIGGRTIVNQTALSGTYNFTLRWTRERLSAPSPQSDPAASSSDPDAPPLFSSLQQQLGLRLASTKGPVEVLVIDHVEKPSAN